MLSDLDSLLDSILDTVILASDNTSSDNILDTDLITLIELPEAEADPRLKLLSHSSRTTLHKCPRKYQLYRLSSEEVELSEAATTNQAVTFAYGHAVGTGIQSSLEELEDKSTEQIILDVFLAWDTDLLAENPKQKKSFWTALSAVLKFSSLRSRGLLADYKLVYHNGKPAVELSFEVILPNNYRYRGFVDAVLVHKVTGEVLVLEAKTTSGQANSASYKNSGQALGYSVILDILFPAMSSYTVLYIVQETGSGNYVEMPFTKSLLQRALWLQELLIDTQLVELYHSYGTFPTHGESCFDFFRPCEYLGICNLPTSNLTKPLTNKIMDKISASTYDFTISFEDLVSAQIAKGKLFSSSPSS